jgi:hypothetical protein
MALWYTHSADLAKGEAEGTIGAYEENASQYRWFCSGGASLMTVGPMRLDLPSHGSNRIASLLITAHRLDGASKQSAGDAEHSDRSASIQTYLAGARSSGQHSSCDEAYTAAALCNSAKLPPTHFRLKRG